MRTGKTGKFILFARNGVRQNAVKKAGFIPTGVSR